MFRLCRKKVTQCTKESIEKKARRKKLPKPLFANKEGYYIMTKTDDDGLTFKHYKDSFFVGMVRLWLFSHDEKQERKRAKIENFTREHKKRLEAYRKHKNDLNER